MEIRGYLKLSIVVALATIALKTAAWWISGSIGLLSDALESLVNLAGASFALMMVVIAERPADEGHPYGHDKAEYFSSGFEGMMIFATAIAIFWAAAHRGLNPQPLQSVGLGIGLSVISSVLNGVLAVAMLRKARAHRSAALEGDARHLITDVWTSAGVILGVVGVVVTGWLWLDPLIAVLVALNIVREGFGLVRRAADGLMDPALEPEVLEQIENVLQGFRRPNVRFDHVATRRAGRRRFADLHMHVPASWDLAHAASLRADVEHALLESIDGLRVRIELLPSDVEPQFEPVRASAA